MLTEQTRFDDRLNADRRESPQECTQALLKVHPSVSYV